MDALPDNSWVEWRTSTANIEQLRSFLQSLKQQADASPERLRTLETVTAGMARAGVETSADSLYMDVRSQRLPSGLARIPVPMKVYRGRARGSNEPHVPDRRYARDMCDTSALEARLLKP